jgi:endonuclease YncB( thermonuclease family)
MTPADFDAHLYHYAATCLRVVDGDTFVALVDCGFGVRREIHVRITGYDAPELHGPTAEAGLAARTELNLHFGFGAPLRLQTRKDSASFERYLARVYVQRHGELVDVADLMIASGHGVPM